jgi:hypothetical protein
VLSVRLANPQGASTRIPVTSKDACMPEDEIDVTPAMIDTGMDRRAELDGLTSSAYQVAEVF